MNKESIKKELTDKHNSFIDYINSLSDNEFIYKSNPAKWSAGQQLQHIYLSVRPINIALLIPKFILNFLFGKPHQNRTYEDLVVTYQKSLLNGGKAGSLFIPKNVSIGKKKILINDLTGLINSLNEKIERLSEQDLDKYILPHPLIGKISIREMLYFTIYHVQHHHKSVVENIKYNRNNKLKPFHSSSPHLSYNLDKSNEKIRGNPKTVHPSVHPQQKTLARSIPARVSVFLKWCGPCSLF